MFDFLNEKEGERPPLPQVFYPRFFWGLNPTFLRHTRTFCNIRIVSTIASDTVLQSQNPQGTQKCLAGKGFAVAKPDVAGKLT